MSQRIYRLPSGATTCDVEDYIDEWHELAEPIETELGVYLHSFGDDLAFTDGRHYHFTVKLSIALLIKKLVNERDALLGNNSELKT